MIITKTIILLSLSLAISVMVATIGYAQTPTMVFIKGGIYAPIYGNDSIPVKVNDFYIDIMPVTNNLYQKFVKDNVKWRKSKVKKIFADGNYMGNWKNDTTPDVSQNMNSPVTNVSWFAANEYCRCQGKRLPTVDEWEYVAMANKNLPDARKLKTYNEYILSWYEAPKSYANTVGSTFKNYWGVYDMHGLVWEWTYDFNSVLISGESRKDSSNDRNLFCGSGSLGATDLMNYAAFMRYAFRGSLKANYAVRNLGFRCASDMPIKN
ncbi:MAG: formylglycine-generating enzyme family protein [Bacteroidetes bacterium]|nr:formylglycine-generating enzyme family protein [Bacteroidota bacterium]